MSDTSARIVEGLRLSSGSPCAMLRQRTHYGGVQPNHQRRKALVELDFSRSGKPTDNAMIKAFNTRLRAEGLNESRFLSLEDAREKIEGLAPALQRRTPPQRPGQPRPGGLCPGGHSRGSMTHETSATTGTKNGARPDPLPTPGHGRTADRLPWPLICATEWHSCSQSASSGSPILTNLVRSWAPHNSNEN